MILSAKDVNGTVEITTVFSDPATGVDTDPDTSAVVNIYPANSDTQIITDGTMSKKDGKDGWLKYAFDTSGVTAGTLVIFVTIVHDSGTYSSNTTHTVTDTSIDGVDGKVDTIDTNVDAILVDTGTTIPATLTTIDTTVTATNNTVQTNLDTKVSTAGLGDGDIPVKFLLKINDVIRPGERIWVTSDVAGVNIKSQENLTTNSSGIRQWTLQASTYYVWLGSSVEYLGTLTVVSSTDQTFALNPNF